MTVLLSHPSLSLIEVSSRFTSTAAGAAFSRRGWFPHHECTDIGSANTNTPVVLVWGGLFYFKKVAGRF